MLTESGRIVSGRVKTGSGSSGKSSRTLLIVEVTEFDRERPRISADYKREIL